MQVDDQEHETHGYNLIIVDIKWHQFVVSMTIYFQLVD